MDIIFKNKILNLLYKTIDEVNERWPSEKKIKKALNVNLLGKDRVLDSLDLMDFLVVFEKNLQQGLARPVSLVDDAKLLRTTGTVIEIVDYLSKSLVRSSDTRQATDQSW